MFPFVSDDAFHDSLKSSSVISISSGLSFVLSSEQSSLLFSIMETELNRFFNSLLLYECITPIHTSPAGMSEFRVLSLSEGKVDQLSSTRFQCKSFLHSGFFLLPSFSSLSSLSCKVYSTSTILGSFFLLSSCSSSVNECKILQKIRIPHSLTSPHYLILSLDEMESSFK